MPTWWGRKSERLPRECGGEGTRSRQDWRDLPSRPFPHDQPGLTKHSHFFALASARCGSILDVATGGRLDEFAMATMRINRLRLVRLEQAQRLPCAAGQGPRLTPLR